MLSSFSRSVSPRQQRCFRILCSPRLHSKMSTLPTSEESVLPRYNAASLPRWLAREESPRLYKPGGLRPTGPGDVLADGRYRILAKAGSGMFSTVWSIRTSLSSIYPKNRGHITTTLHNREKCVSIKILSGKEVL